jgi:small-conductance mechanosensitive channel
VSKSFVSVLCIGVGLAVCGTTECQVSSPPVSSEVDATPIDSGSPVVFFGRELFRVRSALGPFTAEERASAIVARLDRVLRDPVLRRSDVVVTERADASDVTIGDLLILSVTDADAAAEGRPRREIAEERARILEENLAVLRIETSPRSIAIGIGLTVLTTVVLVLAFRAIGWFFRKLDRWVHHEHSWLRPFRIHSYEFVSADRIRGGIVAFFRFARLVVTLAMLYVYLPLVLGFFPWTAGLAGTLYGHLFASVRFVGQTIVSYLPNVAVLLVIAVVTHYAVRFTRFIFAEIEKGALVVPQFYPDWADPTYKIARFFIVVLALVVAFPYLPGSGSKAFQGVSLFIGVVFSLGSTSAIANIIAGAILTYMRGFQLGDRVKIADTVGDVTEKTLLVTRIRTSKNVITTIPNAAVLSSHIVNFSASAANPGLILHTTVTIGYDVPWRQVHALLIAAAKATEGILETPEPFVLQTGLNDFYPSYELNVYTTNSNAMARLYSDLHQNIQDQFNAAGVEILSPHYNAMRDGNPSTVPAEHLPRDYQSPGYRVEIVPPRSK